MIGSLIGGAMKIGGAIFGGIKASQAMKKVRKNIEAQRQDNKDRFDRMYNEDSTQRADAQSVLSQTQDYIRDRNRQAVGAAAVSGATDEGVAAAKAANNEALAEATSRIAVAGDARKDAIESQYRATDQNLQSQLNNMQINKAGAIAQGVQGVSSAAAGVATGIEDYLDYKAQQKEGNERD